MLVRELSDEDDSTRGSLFDDESSHADINEDRVTKPRTVLTLAPPLLRAASSLWPKIWVGCGTLVIPIATIPSAAEHAAATDVPPPSPGDLVSIKFVVGRGNSAVAASDPTSVFPVVVDLASLVHSIEPAPSVDNTALLQRISRHHAEVEATWKWCPSSHSSSTTHSRRSMWRLVSLVVCDCRSLFGTCCNSVRLVPAVRTCIDVDTSVQDGQSPRLVFGGTHGIDIDFEKKVEPLAVPDTISAVPVSATAVVDAWAQTEVDELPPLTKKGRQSGKKQPASAQQKVPRQPNRSSSSSNANSNSVEKPSKVIIVDDEESAPQELLPHPHGDATTASRTNVSTNNADDTSVSILETQLGGRRESRYTNGAMFVGDLVGPSMSTCTVPADHSRPLTIVTTGTRLTAEERKACEKVSLTVNPPMTLFHSATYLVMEPPLVRSVKLMTAIPFVEAFVHRSWLAAVLASGRMDVPVQRHLYSETYTRRGIEAANGFRIDELAAVPPSKRQALLRGFSVFVHVQAQPQDEPLNDLKHVVAASGGVLCGRMSDADLIVLPTAPLAPRDRKSLQEEGYSSDAILITVEDLFRAVLQQKRPMASTIEWADSDKASNRKRARTATPRQR